MNLVLIIIGMIIFFLLIILFFYFLVIFFNYLLGNDPTHEVKEVIKYEEKNNEN